MLYLYLVTLLIAPQVWLSPFIGFPVDVLLYPIWLLAAYVNGSLKKTGWGAFDNFFLLFVVWGIVSTVINGYNEFGQKLFVDYLKWFVLYRLVISSINTFPKLNRLIIFIGILALVIGIQSVQHKYSPDGVGWAGQTLGWVDKSVIDTGGTGRTQWIHIFDGPGVFCVIFLMALPFYMVFLYQPASSFMRLYALIMVPACLFFIYLTGSRGGLIAMIIILGLHYLLRQPGGLFRFRKYLIYAPFVISILMLAPSHLTNLNDDSRSASNRIEMWAEGIEMLEQNPVFGIGLGNFLGYTGKLIAHNSTIELMGELGLPGLFSWLALLYLSFKALYLVACHSKNEYELNVTRSITCSIAGYFMASMFVTLEYETYYILLAMAMSIAHINGIAVTFTKNDLKWLCIIVAIWYIFIKSLVTMYFIVFS